MRRVKNISGYPGAITVESSISLGKIIFLLGFEWTHAMFMFCLWFCNALAVFIVFCLDGHVFMSFQAGHIPEVLSSPFGRFWV